MDLTPPRQRSLQKNFVSTVITSTSCRTWSGILLCVTIIFVCKPSINFCFMFSNSTDDIICNTNTKDIVIMVCHKIYLWDCGSGPAMTWVEVAVCDNFIVLNIFRLTMFYSPCVEKTDKLISLWGLVTSCPCCPCWAKPKQAKPKQAQSKQQGGLQLVFYLCWKGVSYY